MSTWGRCVGILVSFLWVSITPVALGAPRSWVERSKPESANEHILVKFRRATNARKRTTLHDRVGCKVDRAIKQLGIDVLSVPPGRSAADLVRTYRRHPLIEFAEPERWYAPAFVPNDPDYPRQWHLPRIGAPDAWDITPGTSDVTIAVLDSGVDDSLPELASHVMSGWNTFDGNADTSDVTGHGTSVAGTVAATGNNGALVASVAWGCTVMPVRVSNLTGMASDTTIAAGLVWAADHGARVANVSYEILQSATLVNAAQYFNTMGGLVIFASGNSGLFNEAADNPWIVKVGATDRDDNVPAWSNTGNDIDLCAPGVSIVTIGTAGGTASGAGTSFSAPIVAGVSALVYSANPALNPAEVEDILKQSADDLGSPGWEPTSGWGRVNAGRAVSLALDYGTTSDTTPPTVAFMAPSNGAVLMGMAAVEVEATDNLAVSRVDLFINGSFHSSDQIPPHEWVIDTSVLVDGPTVLEVVAYDAAGNVSEPATVDVTVENTVPECTTHTACDDGQYCNGIETCDPVVGCVPGVAPCLDQLCDELTDACVDCLNDLDCDDGNLCTVDTCDSGHCEYPPLACEDADACTIDTCNIDIGCVNEPVVCPPDEVCVNGVCEVLACNANGICEEGEDCRNCPDDCPTVENAWCGNGTCETADGEDCLTCPVDCEGVQSGAPSRRFCCGAGAGVNPIECSDPRCTVGGLACVSDPVVPSCCGDLVCEGIEDEFMCEIDCASAHGCGDGVCSVDEDTCSCEVDCGSPPSSENLSTGCTDGVDNDCDGLIDCDDRDCDNAVSCSPCDYDGVCESGENCRNCVKDCPGDPESRRSESYCCGNGVLESPEGDGDLCDGNP